jgi:CDGSH-type Zn-finger protein
MSKKQPFCDRSHKGTGFKPVNFKIGEKVESIFLCGCKLSSKAPFCDGVTCKELNENYEKELNKKLEQINIKI